MVERVSESSNSSRKWQKKKHQGILKRIVPPMQEAFADFEILDLLQYLQILQYHTDLLQ